MRRSGRRWHLPTTAATNFAVNLFSANFPNTSGDAMTGTTGYSLRLWEPSSNHGIQRTTKYATGTTNTFCTESDRFVALDTFRSSVLNYMNKTNSYPTVSIAFGAVAVPEPATCASLLAGLGFTKIMAWRRCKSV